MVIIQEEVDAFIFRVFAGFGIVEANKFTAAIVVDWSDWRDIVSTYTIEDAPFQILIASCIPVIFCQLIPPPQVQTLPHWSSASAF